MDWIRTLLSRIAAFFGRQKLDADLDEELRTHIELAVEENLKQGMNAQEARRAALVKLGYVVKVDGEPSAATSTELRDFERAHGLPPSNDVTPRLLKALSTAAAVAGR